MQDALTSRGVLHPTHLLLPLLLVPPPSLLHRPTISASHGPLQLSTASLLPPPVYCPPRPLPRLDGGHDCQLEKEEQAQSGVGCALLLLGWADSDIAGGGEAVREGEVVASEEEESEVEALQVGQDAVHQGDNRQHALPGAGESDDEASGRGAGDGRGDGHESGLLLLPLRLGVRVGRQHLQHVQRHAPLPTGQHEVERRRRMQRMEQRRSSLPSHLPLSHPSDCCCAVVYLRDLPYVAVLLAQ